MLREKKCKKCGKYYQYDNGLIESGLGSTNEDRDGIKKESLERKAFCPLCDDPKFISGLSYKKVNILWMFKKYLRSEGIEIDSIPDDSIEEMMRSFPQTYAAYTSNGTFRTITLFPDTKFKGEYGEFKLGIAYPRNPESFGVGRIWHDRYIICLRCGKQTTATAQRTLFHYLGLCKKRCKKCDLKHYYPNGKRNTSGLLLGGEHNRSESTDRALAKALNVSRMDYRRNKDRITKPVPSLPVGTLVGPYEIIAAYWDDDPSSYSPKYLVQCTDCKKEFRILQKKIRIVQHWCPAHQKAR